LKAARGFFEINGLCATSMDDIVEAAGMPGGGVLGQRPGKDAAITAIAEKVVGGPTVFVRPTVPGGCQPGPT
jgi:AcrR family transcriptional regulator